MDSPIIEFKNFSFKYDALKTPTIKNINLSINRGEKILIAGQSGCGKSTLCHLINGLIPHAYPGEIRGELNIFSQSYETQDIFQLSKHIGTVLQDTDGQFIGLTVAEDIAFSLENQMVKDPDLHRRVEEVAKIVNINTHLKNSPSELSGGQKQRVSLAGVMVNDVDVLLFDEPLANLDPKTGKKAMELIDKIHEETGVTIIIIEHRIEDVLTVKMDRIILMNDGEIVADNNPNNILATNLLTEHGIREPLYISAMKYSGIQVKPEMNLENILKLNLNEEDKAKLLAWFDNRQEENKTVKKTPVLEARNLEFTYKNDRKIMAKKPALKNINIAFNRGDITAIVGKNGAGKSTFSKVVCGFEEIDLGEILVKSKNIKDLSIKERAEHIGCIMQNPNQMISKNMIFDEVSLALRNKGLSEDEIRPIVEENLKICGLWEYRNWPISALSFGQKKRVTIASILSTSPEIIILDEPTAGQDYSHYNQIMNFLEELNKQGISIIIITHDMHLMLEYADEAVVFSDSEIIAKGKPAMILTDLNVIEKANLKETSLIHLAEKIGVLEGYKFVQHFINYERNRVVDNG